MPNSKSLASAPRIPANFFAWQGWRLDLPPRWNPVKLEGDHDKGFALFADLVRPRLGIRWNKQRRGRLKLDAWIGRVLRDEVGRLAAEEAKPLPMPDDIWQGSTLYTEPQPPGRDVWIGYSRKSDRLVQLIYHAHRRERLLADTILPTLVDLPQDQPMPWSVFELSCIIPPGFRLHTHRLNAGDLSLTFLQRRRGAPRQVSVRQVAVAELALKRMPIEKWLDDQQRGSRKFYSRARKTTPLELALGERELAGISRLLKRRWRFFFMFRLPSRFITWALHDEARDRLVFVEGSDEQLVRDVAASVGHAAGVSADADRALDNEGADSE